MPKSPATLLQVSSCPPHLLCAAVGHLTFSARSSLLMLLLHGMRRTEQQRMAVLCKGLQRLQHSSDLNAICTNTVRQGNSGIRCPCQKAMHSAVVCKAPHIRLQSVDDHSICFGVALVSARCLSGVQQTELVCLSVQGCRRATAVTAGVLTVDRLRESMPVDAVRCISPVSGGSYAHLSNFTAIILMPANRTVTAC